MKGADTWTTDDLNEEPSPGWSYSLSTCWNKLAFYQKHRQLVYRIIAQTRCYSYEHWQALVYRKETNHLQLSTLEVLKI